MTTHTNHDAIPIRRLGDRRLPRRSVLGRSLVALAGLMLGACGAASDPPTAVIAPASQPTSEPMETATLAPLEDGMPEDSPRMFATLDEAVFAAEIVIIGELDNVGSVVNTVRDSRDRSKPDSLMASVGQVYQVRVQRYLKGTGPPILNVLQGEGYYRVAQTATPQIIERARLRYRDVQLRPGITYLFLLKGFDLPPEGRFYGGPSSPWRFTLPTSGLAEVASLSNDVIKRRFPPRPTTAFLAEVEALAKLPPGSPTRTPVPATATPPRPPTRTPLPATVTPPPATPTPTPPRPVAKEPPTPTPTSSPPRP